MNEKLSNELFDVAFLWSLLLVNAEEVAHDYMEVAALDITQSLDENYLEFKNIESVVLYKEHITLTDYDGNSIMLPHILHPALYLLACHTLNKIKQVYIAAYELVQLDISETERLSRLAILRQFFVENP